MQAVGTFRHTLDIKSRMAMPAQFRDELGETFFVMRGPDKCLFVYDQEGFDALCEQIARKSATAAMRTAQRKTFFGAFKPEMDKQGRFVVPQELVTYAGLQKDVVVFGCNNRIEIWDAAAWDQMMAQEPEEEYDDIIW